MRNRTNFVIILWIAALNAASIHTRTAGAIIDTIGTGTGPALSPSDTALHLADCVSLARRNNAQFMIACEKVLQAKGDNLIAASRLVPHLSGVFGGCYEGYRDSGASSGTDRRQVEQFDLVLSQRLLEFGATKPEEFERLRNSRNALYNKENALARIVSRIRQVYFSLRVIQEQLARHDTLVSVYETKLSTAQERLSRGAGNKFDVLAARSNMLDEKERILNLRQKRRTLAAELKNLLGVTSLIDSIRCADVPSALDMAEDTCVARALDASTQIADIRAEAELLKRQLRESGYNFAPGISISGGVRNGLNSVGIEVTRADDESRHAYSVNAIAKRTVMPPDSVVFRSTSAPGISQLDRNQRYTAQISVTLPLFQGGKAAASVLVSGARYNEARATIIDQTRQTELAVRGAWGEWRLAVEKLSISRERVDIAQQRYELAEAQRELVRITDNEFDNVRRELFYAQDGYFEQEFSTLEREEAVRLLVREFD
jgi:outer membrane protein TolC